MRRTIALAGAPTGGDARLELALTTPPPPGGSWQVPGTLRLGDLTRRLRVSFSTAGSAAATGRLALDLEGELLRVLEGALGGADAPISPPIRLREEGPRTPRLGPSLLCRHAVHALVARCVCGRALARRDGALVESLETCACGRRRKTLRSDEVLRASVQRDEACRRCPHRTDPAPAHCQQAAFLLNRRTVALLIQEGEHPNLPTWLAQGERGIAELCELLMRLCAGIRSLHRLEVVGLDLRPANVLIDDAGTPRPRLGRLGQAWAPATRAALGRLHRHMSAGRPPSRRAQWQVHPTRRLRDDRLEVRALKGSCFAPGDLVVVSDAPRTLLRVAATRHTPAGSWELAWDVEEAGPPGGGTTREETLVLWHLPLAEFARDHTALALLVIGVLAGRTAGLGELAGLAPLPEARAADPLAALLTVGSQSSPRRRELRELLRVALIRHDRVRNPLFAVLGLAGEMLGEPNRDDTWSGLRQTSLTRVAALEDSLAALREAARSRERADAWQSLCEPVAVISPSPPLPACFGREGRAALTEALQEARPQTLPAQQAELQRLTGQLQEAFQRQRQRRGLERRLDALRRGGDAARTRRLAEVETALEGYALSRARDGLGVLENEIARDQRQLERALASLPTSDPELPPRLQRELDLMRSAAPTDRLSTALIESLRERIDRWRAGRELRTSLAREAGSLAEWEAADATVPALARTLQALASCWPGEGDAETETGALLRSVREARATWEQALRRRRHLRAAVLLVVLGAGALLAYFQLAGG